MSTILPKYSIIVHLSERKTFPLCLDALLKQTISKDCYEILLVDGASEEYVFEGELEKVFFSRGVKYLFKKGANYAELNNSAVKAAKGEIIFFTESNCAAPENWLEEFIKIYARHSDVVGVSGWIKAAGGHRKYAQKYLDTLRQKYGAIALQEEKKTNVLDLLYGRAFNMSYKKAALLKIGSFDANFITSEMTAIDAEKRIIENSDFLMYLPFVIEDRGNKNFSGLIKNYFAQGRDFYYWDRKHFRNIFFNFQTPSRFIIYLGVKLIENKTPFFAELMASTMAFFGKTFAKFSKKPVPIMLFESEKEPPETFEIIKKNQNWRIITRFAPFNKTGIFSIDKNQFYSIIIPTYNRSRGLINALNHLIGQTVLKDNYEIIVVDDGSTDDTESVVESFRLKVEKPEIKYFKTENGGPAKARNFGIEKTRGEFIFFTDDDCAVPSNWMETLLLGLKRYPKAAGAGGWYLPLESEMEKTAGFWRKRYARYVTYRMFINSYGQYEILSNDPFRCFGVSAYNTANICYKKEVLQKVGGFKEDFYWPGAEDNELAFRITLSGYPLLYIPFYVIDYNIRDFKEFVKLYFHRGANNYLLRTIHFRTLEELRPGFIGEFGSLASFLSRFLGPEKMMAFLEWISINAGIMYMKNELSKCDHPVLPKPKEKIGNN